MKNRTFAGALGLVLAFLLLFLVNFVVGRFQLGRIDLTANKLFTLSDGTAAILDGLDQKVTLRFYYSKKLAAEIPGLPEYAKRIRELLEEYEAEAGGRLELEVIDPVPFSEAEDRAVSYGLQGAPINQAGDRLYFGLVGTNEVDDEQSIPFFEFGRESRLEYDISELVSNLATLDKKVVGVLSSLPVQGVPDFSNPQAPRPGQPWFVIEQLQSSFETKFLTAEGLEEIEDGISVLLLIHPKNFSDQALYAIDQYVLGGGKAIVFVDPHCQFDEAGGGMPGQPQQSQSSDAGPLLGAWGVELVAGKIVGDRASATTMQRGQPPFLPYLSLHNERMSSDDVTTADLNIMALYCAGRLKPVVGATTTVQPLFSTSKESQEIDTFQMQMLQMGRGPSMFLDNFVPSNTEMHLAVRVSGEASSAYPDGKPEVPADSESLDFEDPDSEDPDAGDEPRDAGESTEHLATGDVNVIVVGDADMLADALWVQMRQFLNMRVPSVHAENGQFVLNAVENMSGSSELISLRTRGGSQRPFTKKIELEERAGDAFRAKEQELEAELRDTEQQINDLQQEKDGASAMILSPEQQQAIAKFEERRLEIRKELREVRHQLRKDIESLGAWLKFMNILLVPGLIIAGAVVIWIQNTLRRAA